MLTERGAFAQKKHPHIIYRYPANGPLDEHHSASPGRPEGNSGGPESRECANSKLHEWALRQHGKGQRSLDASLDNDTRNEAGCEQARCDNGAGRFSKRDVSLTEKYIELALVLGRDFFERRNTSTRLEAIQDALQIINCLDLYFHLSANTRVELIYLETWAHGDQIELSTDAKQTLYNFLDYTTRKLYKVPMDAAHLLTGGRRFEMNEMGMSIPDSICSARAVSVAQESGVFEPFVAAAAMAHMLGHNLGMEHDHPAAPAPASVGSGPAKPDRGLPRPASGRSNQRKAVEGELDGHEEEIKRGRSTSDESESQAWSSLGQDHLGDQAECKSNCLMSERFVYLQPPVSFGQLIFENSTTSGRPELAKSLPGMATGDESTANGSTLEPAHDDDGLMDSSYVMNEREQAVERASGTVLPFKFSRQSVETYLRLLRSGRGICLFNKPNQLEDFNSCGNGIVDKGEDCDCGTFQECLESDSCCDPITCKFKVDAQCIQGACCDRCQLRPRGHICRRARGECDLAELCDGKSGQCGPDVHRQNGEPCQSGAGFCYLGQCPTHDGQCAELWGADARRADRICYEKQNSNGTVRGNCGHQEAAGNSQPVVGSQQPSSTTTTTTTTTISGKAKFKRCELEHIMCGTLQCQLGDMKPVFGPIESTNDHKVPLAQFEFSKKILYGPDGIQHECKAITSAQSAMGATSLAQSQARSSSISYVLDGTKCGPNRVCFNRTCSSLELVYHESRDLCPRDERGQFCSGNGVCSSANRCHCEPSWTGRDCSQRWPNAVEAPLGSVGAATSTGAPSSTPEESLIKVPLQQVQVHLAPLAALGLLNASERAPNGLGSVTAAPAALPAAPSSPTSQSTVVLDKKKHDAMSAPTLVFILVSMVAAVYVGFALMANCYRRKGFIRPDKVLRHHQINCKLDALRSSLIAKRLADAEAAAISTFEGAAPDQPPTVLGGPFVGLSPAGCQSIEACGAPAPPEPERYLIDQHYFNADFESAPDPPTCSNQHQLEAYSFEAATTSGDHIPLLMACGGQQQLVPEPGSSKRASMRGRTEKLSRRTQCCQETLPNWMVRAGNGAKSRAGANHQSMSMMNRAASLGNVNRQRAMSRMIGVIDDEPASDECSQAYEHNLRVTHKAKAALATPLRARRSRLAGRIITPVDDSCSALSSPESRALVLDPYLSDTDTNQATVRGHRQNLYHSGSQAGPDARRTASMSRPRADLQPSRSHGYHEEAIVGTLVTHRQAERACKEELALLLPPLPPPPAPSSSRTHASQLNQDSEPGEPSDAEAETRALGGWPSPVQIKRKSEAGLTWTNRIVRQVPLNEPHESSQTEQVSLINQLRQLERVQSLHRKQLADGSKAGSSSSTHDKPVAESADERLHEFFALPLSVQLSALLARTLVESRPAAGDLNAATPIDDYLSTLNNSHVAASSRRGFKTSKEQLGANPHSASSSSVTGCPAGSSRSGTFKKNQVKLHNLQALIERLQKLHNQTVLQQQLDELNDELGDNQIAAGSVLPTSDVNSDARKAGATSCSSTDTEQTNPLATLRKTEPAREANTSSSGVAEQPPAVDSSESLE